MIRALMLVLVVSACTVQVSDERSRCVDSGSIALLADDNETVIGCMSPAALDGVTP